MLSPSLRTKKNESTPPLGLKCIVPNIYLAFSCRPLGSLIEFPCGGGDCSCNASLSQPNVQKNSRVFVRAMRGGGLKFEKKK